MPWVALPWFLEARKIYENENLNNLHSLVLTGEKVENERTTGLENLVLKAHDSDPVTMRKMVLDSLGRVQDGQIPALDSFMQRNSVDVIVHDPAAFAAHFMSKKYNVPCVSVSAIMNDDAAFMQFWRPPIGMGLHPAAPGFLDRIGLVLGNFLSRSVMAYATWSNIRRGEMLLYDRDTGWAMERAIKMLKGCPFQSLNLVSVHPGLDQAQTTAPSTVFVGPMRDFDRFVPLKAGSPELQFLNQALADGVPVVFMAAGVTAWITKSFVEDRLELIKELTRDGTIRVLWASKRGIGKRSIDEQNVLVATWLPQEAVLRHDAVKVFVTHGGAMSMMEGVAAGVPFLCSPFAFEQINNCMLLQYRKMGVYIPKKSPVKDFVSGILELLANNTMYAEQVSAVWKRVAAVGEGENAFGARRAVHMVESAAESGTDYLHPEVCKWPLYQLFHLDFLFFSFVTLTVLFWLIRLICIRTFPNKAFSHNRLNKKKVD